MGVVPPWPSGRAVEPPSLTCPTSAQRVMLVVDDLGWTPSAIYDGVDIQRATVHRMKDDPAEAVALLEARAISEVARGLTLVTDLVEISAACRRVSRRLRPEPAKVGSEAGAVAAVPTPGARGCPRSPAGLPVRATHSLVVTVAAHLCATPACFSSRSSGLRSGAGLQPGPESVRRRPAQILCPSAGADDKHLLHCAINDDEARPDVRPKVRFRCAEAASPASCAALVREPPARADPTARVRGNDRSASW